MPKISLSDSEIRLFEPLEAILEDFTVKQLVAPHLGNAFASTLFRAAIRSVALSVKISEAQGLKDCRNSQLEFMISSLQETYTAELRALDSAPERFDQMLQDAAKMRELLLRLPKGSQK